MLNSRTSWTTETQEPLSHPERKDLNRKIPGIILLISTKALINVQDKLPSLCPPKTSLKSILPEYDFLNKAMLLYKLVLPRQLLSTFGADTEKGEWRKFKAYLKYSPRYQPETSSPYSRYREIINGH